MEDIQRNHDNLPILTEIVRPETMAMDSANPGVANLRVAILESDPDGYDPYNSAPPVPVDGETFK